MSQNKSSSKSPRKSAKAKKPVTARKADGSKAKKERGSLIAVPKKEFDEGTSLPLLAPREEKETAVVLANEADDISKNIQGLFDDLGLIEIDEPEEEEDGPLHKAATFYLPDGVHERLSDLYADLRRMYDTDAPGKNHLVAAAMEHFFNEVMVNRSSKSARMKRAKILHRALELKQEAKEHMKRKKQETWIRKSSD